MLVPVRAGGGRLVDVLARQAERDLSGRVSTLVCGIGVGVERIVGPNCGQCVGCLRVVEIVENG